MGSLWHCFTYIHMFLFRDSCFLRMFDRRSQVNTPSLRELPAYGDRLRKVDANSAAPRQRKRWENHGKIGKKLIYPGKHEIVISIFHILFRCLSRFSTKMPLVIEEYKIYVGHTMWFMLLPPFVEDDGNPNDRENLGLTGDKCGLSEEKCSLRKIGNYREKGC